MRSILVVDPDPSFTSPLGSEKGGIASSFDIAPLTTSSVEAAIGHVADPARAILAAFVDAGPGPGNWIPLLESMSRLRPCSPVFLLGGNGPPPVTDAELRALGVRGLVGKPIGFGAMVRLASPLSISRSVDGKLNTLRSASLPPYPVEADRDPEFVPIAADGLLARCPVRTDLYLRLSSGRYFKVLHSGDLLDSDRFDTYIAGGVTHFHFRRDEHERLLREFSRLTAKLVADPGVSSDAKISVTLDFGEEVTAFLRASGIDEAAVTAAKDYVSRAFDLVRALDLGRSPSLETLVAEIPTRSHEASTALVAQLLAARAGMDAREAAETAGVAALLHDIGLIDAPPSIAQEDVSRMTLEEAHLFREHPEVGARMLAGVRGLAPEVLEAVARHHVRRNGQGFPPRTSGDRESPVAEIVGAADELVRLIVAAARNGGNSDPLARMASGPLQGFSPWLAKAFADLFRLT